LIGLGEQLSGKGARRPAGKQHAFETGAACLFLEQPELSKRSLVVTALGVDVRMYEPVRRPE
jgi:hypothetical protein